MERSAVAPAVDANAAGRANQDLALAGQRSGETLGAATATTLPSSCDVQWPHRVAPSGMALRQKGYSFVFGGGGAGTRERRFAAFTIVKMAAAMIRKPKMLLRNIP